MRSGWLLLAGLTLTGMSCGGSRQASPVAAADTTVTPTRLPIEHWGQKLASSSRKEQQGAAGMLAQYGSEAVPYVPALVRLLESSDDTLAFTAAWTLARIGNEGIAPMMRLLSHSSAAVRRRAAYGLKEVGPAAAAAVPDLTRLADTDPVLEVRYMAQAALATIEEDMVADPNLILTAGLTDSDLPTRLRAIRRLGASSPSDRVAVPVLIFLLGDSTAAVRGAAVDALAEKGSSAYPLLTVALTHPRRLVRAGAMLAMTRMRRPF
jgi:HEAT repeat protein